MMFELWIKFVPTLVRKIYVIRHLHAANFSCVCLARILLFNLLEVIVVILIISSKKIIPNF